MIIPDFSSLPVVWWKSSVSHAQSDCLECGIVNADHIAVRDSKVPSGPALIVGREAFTAMVGAVSASAYEARAVMSVSREVSKNSPSAA